MSQPITVAQLNRYAASLLETDSRLNPVLVQGELSGVKSYSSGHLYFTLKDEEAAVSCVMFKSQATRLRFRPSDGLKVVVTAKASIYDRDGRFQLYVSDMNASGVGDLYLAFEQLKKRLEAEGLFAAAHKRKIPLLPKAIGVVTSPSGAVIRDIIQVLSRRFPNFRLYLMPVQVQGEGAAAQIAAAIARFNQLGNVDVLIVGRGGGSLEDLWAFNEEMVARAVYQSRIPVISAVGHETDFTICDFAADLRAPTPSAAAELAMPVKKEQEHHIHVMRSRLAAALGNRLAGERQRLAHLKTSAIFRLPYDGIDRRRMDVDRLSQKARQITFKKIDLARHHMAFLVGKLDVLSPLKVLARGFGLVTSAADGRILMSTALITPGDRVDIRLCDGILNCEVLKVMDGR